MLIYIYRNPPIGNIVASYIRKEMRYSPIYRKVLFSLYKRTTYSKTHYI